MVRDTILCLCDLTGIMAVPWVEHGYRAVLVDPQHGFSREEGSVAKLALTVWEAMPYIGDLVRGNRVAFVAAFPPCTDMAVSGARWFDRKRRADPLFQAKAVDVAEQCRIVGKLSGAPYFVENPVSVLSGVFGHPDYTFHPFQFTRWCAADNYRKRTCLWVGNGFVMPPPETGYVTGRSRRPNSQMSAWKGSGELPQQNSARVRQSCIRFKRENKEVSSR